LLQRDAMSQNILLIQDDPSEARAVRDALLTPTNQPYRIQWVRLCSEGLRQLALRDHGPDSIGAILTELELRDCHGIETFDRLRFAAPRVPIVILCRPQDAPTAQLALGRGAQDYLLKTQVDRYWFPKVLHALIQSAVSRADLLAERERTRVTLGSVADAVVTADFRGRVNYLNGVAEAMTGWTQEEAANRDIAEIVKIVDATTRCIVPNPVVVAIRENKAVSSASNHVLLSREGTESVIEDSAAPIHDGCGRAAGAVMVFRDVSLARARALRMAHLAQHDSLTELPNRVLFEDRLTQAMIRARRNRHRLAVLYLDIDRFKSVNDALGHAAGDQLLRSIAKRLGACVRSSDTVCRHGGDEFVILLPEIGHSEDAGVIAQKVLLSLGAPHRVAEQDVHVTGSIGIVTFPEDGTDLETLLARADIAMYKAKAAGRDRYQFFEPTMDVRRL
jgi:diguanylate cyclase (GGDEF)-like protein/PAS domain S-box-containing protein